MNEASTMVRVSAAALARIMVGERLALALSKAQLCVGRRVFSPFGGAIAASSLGRTFLEKSLSAVFEELPRSVSEEEWVDLRFSLPESNLAAFETWFGQRQDREWGPAREVLEELIETGVLGESEAFADLVLSREPSYLGMVRRRAESHRPRRVGVITERFAEVFEVRLAPRVEERLMEIAARGEGERTVLLLTEDEIRQEISSLAVNCLDLLPEARERRDE
jgi:SMODS-associated NUDIX domain